MVLIFKSKNINKISYTKNTYYSIAGFVFHKKSNIDYLIINLFLVIFK